MDRPIPIPEIRLPEFRRIPTPSIPPIPTIPTDDPLTLLLQGYIAFERGRRLREAEREMAKEREFETAKNLIVLQKMAFDLIKERKELEEKYRPATSEEMNVYLKELPKEERERLIDVFTRDKVPRDIVEKTGKYLHETKDKNLIQARPLFELAEGITKGESPAIIIKRLSPDIEVTPAMIKSARELADSFFDVMEKKVDISIKRLNEGIKGFEKKLKEIEARNKSIELEYARRKQTEEIKDKRVDILLKQARIQEILAKMAKWKDEIRLKEEELRIKWYDSITKRTKALEKSEDDLKSIEKELKRSIDQVKGLQGITVRAHEKIELHNMKAEANKEIEKTRVDKMYDITLEFLNGLVINKEIFNLKKAPLIHYPSVKEAYMSPLKGFVTTVRAKFSKAGILREFKKDEILNTTFEEMKRLLDKQKEADYKMIDEKYLIRPYPEVPPVLREAERYYTEKAKESLRKIEKITGREIPKPKPKPKPVAPKPIILPMPGAIPIPLVPELAPALRPAPALAPRPVFTKEEKERIQKAFRVAEPPQKQAIINLLRERGYDPKDVLPELKRRL